MGYAFTVLDGGSDDTPPTFGYGNCRTHIFKGKAGTDGDYVAVDFDDGSKDVDASLSGATFTVSDPHLHLLQGLYMTGIRYVSGPDGSVQVDEWQPSPNVGTLCLGPGTMETIGRCCVPTRSF